MLVEGVRDWFDWSGWSFTVGGTILSLVGLMLTFREARAAKERAKDAGTAAEAARAAALGTLRAVSSRTTAGAMNLGGALNDVRRLVLQAGPVG